MNYRGGCHCGRIAFEVEGTLEEVRECNCSICTKKAYLHWMVAQGCFRLLTPRANLATYTFNTHAAKHYFCAVCGVAPFYIARSDPDKIDINVRCVDGIQFDKLRLRRFDGKNWERAQAAWLAGKS